MLRRRLISAAIIIPGIILLLCLDHFMGQDSQLGRQGVILFPLAMIAAALAAGELAAMFENVANKLNQGLAIFTGVVMVMVTSMPAFWQDYPVDCPLGRFGWAISGAVLALVICFFFEMKNYDVAAGGSNGEVVDRLGRYSFIFLYLSMLFGFLLPHRTLHSNAIGIMSIVLVIATVKLSDSFAYFAGKRFGTIKLAPKLSPGKTVQGSIGGLVGGIVAALVVCYVATPAIFDVSFPKPVWWVVLFGLLVTLAGMMGDLAESLIKRDCDTKDSSSWLPGLGGVLDILDSLVFAAPVSYLMWMIAKMPAVVE